MNLMPDPGADTLDRWKHGPGPAALETLLGERPSRVELERVHFPGKRPVQLVYAATMRGGTTAAILAEYCPGRAEETATAATASLRKTRNGQRRGVSARPLVADTATGLVLRRPGLDERLPGLRLLYDTAYARDVVAQLTRSDPGPVTARLVAHRLGKRAVLRLGLRGRHIYARLSANKSGEGQGRLARHRSIWDALGPDVPLSIPEPLGSVPEIGLSLFGELPGHEPEFRRDADAIAGALAALRRCGIQGLPHHSGADEAAILRSWHQRCALYLPDLARRLTSVVERTCETLSGCDRPVAPCHRDLHEKQILVSDGRAGFLDFDTLSLADPALDPGNLAAHLFFAGLDEHPLHAALGSPDITLWRRAALLRLAMIHAFSAKPAAALHRLIDEAAR